MNNKLKSLICAKEDCTNCKACYNVCPKSAISFIKDEYGFEYPIIDEDKCVHCNLCENICNKIPMTSKMYPISTDTMQSKNWELSQNSSSGGIFAQLANYILDQNGIVFGCALEKNEKEFIAKHIWIDDKNDLYKLQGSKYVQSNIGNTYKETENFLKEGRKVLFSGTPCQIAALKTYLKKDYENLLCVDLSCEGVPNIQIFNDYIAFLQSKIKHPVVDFKFRYKKDHAWNTARVVVVVGNERRKIIIPTNKSSYFSLFINCNILRECCYNCKYTGVERVSDITIADAWGIGIEYPNIKEKFDIAKGMSLVLTNTEKGKNVLSEIKETIKTFPIDIEKLKQYNHPLRHPSIISNEREYYLEAYKNEGYASLDKKYLINSGIKKLSIIDKIKKHFTNKEKVDCLLMTMYANKNYGSILVTYSLYKILQNFGLSVKIINDSLLKGFNLNFYSKYCKLTDKIYSKDDYKDLNKITSTFILGSDNLLNYTTDSFKYITKNLFNFSDFNKKRIIIAGSIGDWNGKFKKLGEKTYFKSLLKRFSYISTRENHGKEIFENVFNTYTDWINDPVMFLSKEEYLCLLPKIQKDYSDSILQYIVYPTKETDKIVDYFKTKLNSKSITFQINEKVKDSSLFDSNVSVENWLNMIVNSKLIITDSFHCTVFALMFNRPVICIKNNHGMSRFESLFTALGITLPLLEGVDNIENINFDYDKEKVNSAFEKIRNNGIEKIKLAINKSIHKNYFNEIIFKVCNLCITFVKFSQCIFYITNEVQNGKKHKVVTILGLRVKIKVKKK